MEPDEGAAPGCGLDEQGRPSLRVGGLGGDVIAQKGAATQSASGLVCFVWLPFGRSYCVSGYLAKWYGASSAPKEPVDNWDHAGALIARHTGAFWLLRTSDWRATTAKRSPNAEPRIHLHFEHGDREWKQALMHPPFFCRSCASRPGARFSDSV